MSFEACRATRRGIYCKKTFLNKTHLKKKYSHSFEHNNKLEFNDLYNEHSSPDEINKIINNVISSNIEELHIDGLKKIDKVLLINLAFRNKSLKSLIITNTELQESDIVTISKFLWRTKSLNKLEIDFSKLADYYECRKNLNMIIEEINKNEETPFEYISFSNCDIKAKRHTKVADNIVLLLQKCKYLHTLKLQNIGLTDKNIAEMSNYLNAHALEVLDISNNKHISDVGGSYIVKMLEKNKNNNTLKEINVNGTNVSEKIKQEMEKYLLHPRYKSLQWKYMKELLQKNEKYGYKI